MTASYRHEIEVAQKTALEAGAKVLEFYDQGTASIYAKSDGSSVTDADLAADTIIRRRLAEAFPDDAILTEEGKDDLERLTSKRVWIVDPIDGTNQFIKRTGEFDILIALVEEGRPVVGVSYQPTGDVLLSAAKGQGAEMQRAGDRQPLKFLPVADGVTPRIVTSTWLGAPENVEILDRVGRRLQAGITIVSNIGVNLRRFMAPGDNADVFIGLHPNEVNEMAWEWDFAAPDVIAEEAGGVTTNLDGSPHLYNKAEPRNVGGLIMSRDPRTHAQIVQALREDREEFEYELKD